MRRLFDGGKGKFKEFVNELNELGIILLPLNNALLILCGHASQRARDGDESSKLSYEEVELAITQQPQQIIHHNKSIKTLFLRNGQRSNHRALALGNFIVRMIDFDRFIIMQ